MKYPRLGRGIFIFADIPEKRGGSGGSPFKKVGFS